MKKILIVLLLLCGGSSLVLGQGAFTALWNLNTNNTVVVSGAGASLVNAGNFTGGPGINPISYTTDGASSTGWTSASRDLNDYYEITLTAPSDVYLTISTYSVYQRKTSGNMTYMAFYGSTNGFVTSTWLGGANYGLHTTQLQYSLNVGVTLSPGMTYTLRFYAWSLGSDVSYQVENLSINGSSCQVFGNPLVFGDNSWNVYCYNGTNIDLNGIIYRGYYTEPNMSFDSRNRWAANNTPSNASGYQGCPVGIYDHTVVYKRQGFPCGFYQIDLPWMDFHARLYINGIQVWQDLSYCCKAYPNIWKGYLDENSSIEFRWYHSAGSSIGAMTFTSVTPTIDFSSSTQTIRDGNTVTFNGLSNGTLPVWSWSFPGGTPATSNVQNPVIRYFTPGTYDVTLTTPVCGTDYTITKSGYITVTSQTYCTPVLFSQDFNSSNTLSDYISGTPNNSQFNGIGAINGTADIHNQALRLIRNNSGQLQFTRNTDLTGSPLPALMWQFDLTVDNMSAEYPQTLRFQVGSNFTVNYNGEQTPYRYAQFFIEFGYPNKWKIYTTSGLFDPGVPYCITWVLNNSGSGITYTAPNGTSETLGNDRQDIWVGTIRVMNDVGVDNSSGTLSDFKLTWNVGAGAAHIDNILITDPTYVVPTVNQPSDVVTVGGNPVNVNFTGAVASMYLWTNDNPAIGLPGQGTGNISYTSPVVSTPTTATIMVTPSTGFCKGTAKIFTITLNPACTNPDIPTVSATPATICEGTSTTLSVTSGILHDASAWQWYSSSCGNTPVETGPSISVAPTATTTYYVRGEGGCVVAGDCGTVTVDVRQKPAILGITPSNPTCYAGTNGEILLTISGTQPPYTFSVNGGSTYDAPYTGAYPNFTLTGLIAGTEYNVRVKDNNDCQSTNCSP